MSGKLLVRGKRREGKAGVVRETKKKTNDDEDEHTLSLSLSHSHTRCSVCLSVFHFHLLMPATAQGRIALRDMLFLLYGAFHVQFVSAYRSFLGLEVRRP